MRSHEAKTIKPLTARIRPATALGAGAAIGARGAAVASLIALSGALFGCGSASEDLIVGTWEMDGFSCNGTDYSLPSGVTFTLTYNADRTFEAVFTGSASCTVTVTGTYTRSGLSVTENSVLQDCGVSCSIPAIPPALDATNCSGKASRASAHAFVADIPTANTMEQSRHDPEFFCAEGSNEQLRFTKAD